MVLGRGHRIARKTFLQAQLLVGSSPNVVENTSGLENNTGGDFEASAGHAKAGKWFGKVRSHMSRDGFYGIGQ